jgi:hypothetical protein
MIQSHGFFTIVSNRFNYFCVKTPLPAYSLLFYYNFTFCV